MKEFSNMKEAIDFFQGDRFAMVNGMTIDELGDDWCICSMSLREDHKNANNTVMGGVMFTLADFAFAVAANQIHKITVVQNANINFLSAPKGNKLFAKATCKKSGRTSTVMNVDITDETGRDVAQYVGTGYKL
jgi:acyl-CoA thioesterase